MDVTEIEINPDIEFSKDQRVDGNQIFLFCYRVFQFSYTHGSQ